MINDLWYKNAVIYCLSVGTYMDSNGDGIGDFKGLMRRSRLPAWSRSASAPLISMAMCRIAAGCCARAASGHAAVAPRRVMNSCRLN
jgi:hypothetical protein